MNTQVLSDIDFGLIGHPLGHSFSKAFFTRVFQHDKTGRKYENFDLPELTAAALYSLTLLNPKLKGFNVTAPYKQKIIEFLDSVSPEAKAVWAVNTVKINRDKSGRITSLEGHNTDIAGFKTAVKHFTDLLPQGKGAIVLGTGGASAAVIEGLRQLGVDALRVSRNKVGKGIINYSDLTPELIAKNPLIINATPLGTYPNIDTCPTFPFEYLPKGSMAFDLVYNPEITLFMKRAAAAGAKVDNGLEMLYKQALESLNIWQKI